VEPIHHIAIVIQHLVRALVGGHAAGSAKEGKMVRAEDVIFVYQRLSAEHIPVWLTGGWGIDALLGAQTRPHKDLDLIMLLDDVVRMREVLARDGYQLQELWPENSWVQDKFGAETPTAFVLQDSAGRQIDAHAMRIDDEGKGIPAWNNEEGLFFRMDDLAGDGAIAGVPVRCITPAMQVLCHNGYDIPNFQLRDMQLLYQTFAAGFPRRQSLPGEASGWPALMQKAACSTTISLAATGAVITARTYRRYRNEMDVIRERVRAASEVLKTDRGDIEYAVRGEGRPALLLHGAGGGYDQGLLLGKTGPAGFKLISVSRFGYLRSPIPEDSSVEAQAALYAAVVDHLKVERVIVVAGSAGGPSGLQFAHDYPEKCSALVLVSAITMSIAGDKDALHNKLIRSIQKSDFAYWTTTRAFQSLFLELIGVPPEVYKSFAPEQKELAQEMLDVMHPMSLRRAGSIHEFDVTPLDPIAMGEISVPTLILHAKDDQLVGYEHAEFAHRHITQSKLITFETGGHGLLARVAEVRDQVTSFLESVPEK
jgi:pimeloyl-ACP methyl ester carboxylesterase